MTATSTNSYPESLAAVLAAARPLGNERVAFLEAPGRVLAEDVHADRDDPPCDLSAMDGFALRAADTAPACAERPLTFTFREVVGAGHVVSGALPAGGAVRIMTGAMLPPGADAVVKQEHTQPVSEDGFALHRPLQPGENVQGRGSRLRAGERLLWAGDLVTPQALGLLATLGRATVAVFRRPRVGVLALGDELVPAGEPLRPGQIHVSNLYVLLTLLRRYGAVAESLGILGDDADAIERALRAALPGGGRAEGQACDMLITLGGSMRGDFDFVGRVLERLEARVVFDRTRMAPARSTHCALRERCLLFGLPGTPAASWVAFEVLVRPALWRLAGRRQAQHPQVRARLTAPLAAPAGRTHFVPALLRLGAEAEPTVTPLLEGSQGGLPPALLGNALIVCGEDVGRLDAGAQVPVLWLGG